MRWRRYPATDERVRRAALGLWREAAWCHLLFASGQYPPLVRRLSDILADVVGEPPNPPSSPSDRAEVLATAADIFTRLRVAVASRYPLAFDPPVAA